MFHSNLAEKEVSENSCRDRIGELSVVVYWDDLLISIVQIRITLHKVNENIRNFALTYELYIYNMKF